MARGEDDLDYVREAMTADLDTVVVFNILRTFTQLRATFNRALVPRRLTAAQFNALLLLRSAGDQGLLMREIGRRLVVTKSNVTGLVDRLERDGLAVRAKHSDRRATLVRLTRAGDTLLRRAAPPHTTQQNPLAKGLTQREKRTLVRLLSKLRMGMRNQRKKGDA